MYFKKKARVISVLLAAMLASTAFTSCTTTENSSSPSNSSGKDSGGIDMSTVDTLSVFSMSSNVSGLQENWFSKVLEEKFAVKLDIISNGGDATQKLQALMTSGELPDIVVFQDKNKQVSDAVQANLLLNLDDYKDYTKNIEKNAGKSLQYFRDNVSNDTGNAYAVGGYVGSGANPTTTNWGPGIRWDLYKKVGMPEMETFEDLIPVLKKMQELYPTTENGKKVYGMSLWTDWDSAGYGMFFAFEIANLLGIDVDQVALTLPFIEHNIETDEIKTYLDEDSAYMRAIRFYRALNQEGLLDPDSATQKFEGFMAKAAEGQVLFSPWVGTMDGYSTLEMKNADEPIGTMPVFTGESKVLMFDGAYSMGRAYAWAVGANTKYPEKAVSVIDYMYSEEGAMTLVNGPQGVTWDYDDEGKPYLTETGLDAIQNGTALPDGGKIGPAGGLETGQSVFQCEGLSVYSLLSTGETISYEGWDSYLGKNNTKLQNDWKEAMGAENIVDYAKKNDIAVTVPDAYNLVEAKPDDITSKATQIGSIITTNSWKMVFAKDDAEFNALYEEMVTKAKGLGYDEVVEWSKAALKDAQALEEKYK